MVFELIGTWLGLGLGDLGTKVLGTWLDNITIYKNQSKSKECGGSDGCTSLGLTSLTIFLFCHNGVFCFKFQGVNVILNHKRLCPCVCV